MLILGRYKGESIVINNETEVKIIDIKPGGIVSLGIEAPASVTVHREEIQKKINMDKENENTSDKRP
ncbi:MAG: carbon storage regulator [Flavobacteriales bacterium]|nr:carbon storage regulator [Flavobacteriales bacterium]